jgi:hypothetical protein
MSDPLRDACDAAAAEIRAHIGFPEAGYEQVAADCVYVTLAPLVAEHDAARERLVSAGGHVARRLTLRRFRRSAGDVQALEAWHAASAPFSEPTSEGA